MMAVYKELLENSLAASLSAIEIYNKPDFKYRNETFVILIINAWELLLKAKIVRDKGRNALFIKDGGRYKMSRTGNRLTLEIRGAVNALELDNLASDNLESLLEIRDTAIHFYNKDAIAYTIFALGAATLQNYQKLVKEWFGKDLSQYNFYILPLGFKYSFKNFSTINLAKEPEALQNLLSQIITKQAAGAAEANGFYLVADIKAEVVSAKKMAEEPHIKIGIDPNVTVRGIIRNQNLTDRYPYSAAQVWYTVHDALPAIKQTKFYEFIKSSKIKENTKYSAYNFRTKAQAEEYKKSGKIPGATTSIYNHDAIVYILENIEP